MSGEKEESSWASELATKFGYGGARVEKVLCMSLGVTGISAFDDAWTRNLLPLSTASALGVSHDGEGVTGSELHEVMNGALRADSHVQSFSTIPGEEHQGTILQPSLLGYLVWGPIARFTVRLPESEQRYARGMFRPPVPIESFEVHSAGSFWCVSWELGDVTRQGLIGQEFRELYRDAMRRAGSSWRVPGIGPSPLAAGVFFVSLDAPGERISIQEETGNTLVLMPKHLVSADKIAFDVLRASQSQLISYYGAAIEKDAVSLHLREVTSRFTSVTSTIASAHSTQWYQELKRWSLVRAARAGYVEFMKSLVLLESARSNFRASSRDAIYSLRESVFLAPVAKYLARSLRDDVRPASSLVSALQALGGELSTVTLAQVTVWAAIVGAVAYAALQLISAAVEHVCR